MQKNMDFLIQLALEEDIHTEDLSTCAILKKYKLGIAELICKQDGILSGLHVFQRTFQLLDSDISFISSKEDGDSVHKGEVICIIKGDLRAILSAERTALNFLQRMSGISTYTHNVVSLLANTNIQLLDTRKTTPNNRIFEKYAVKVGGGKNHRYNLSDGVMLKDNHIAAAGGIKEAVRLTRESVSFVHKIEVEVENLEMVKEAIEAGADIIMLDNMNVEVMRQAISIIDKRAIIECSGNISIENIEKLKELDIDYISSGSITYNAPILDFSLKNINSLD